MNKVDHKKQARIKRIRAIEERILELKDAIRCYSLDEWYWRTGLQSLDSLKKTLELNEFVLEMLKKDIPISFFRGVMESVVSKDYYFSSTIARA